MNASVQPSTPYVLRLIDEGVATLTLNRGDRFNPLSLPMLESLQTELDAVADDPNVRAIVIAARGRGFCAGHDLKELSAHADDPDWQQRLFGTCNRLMLALTQSPLPVIARVHGMAFAAGCQLVSMCDLAVSVTTAQFALPGINVGVFCTTPAVGVVRNVQRKHAMEMLLTGAPIDAATALSRGLVNQVVELDELDAAVNRYTSVIKLRSRSVIAAGKQAFYRQADLSIAAAYALAGDAMVDNIALDDAHEGMAAFVDKRPPRWN